jgi:methylmalonyl-CoA/ethylmalonyl-CoA epimerase
MAFSLGPVGQIGFGVSDIDRAEAFYGGVLALRKLFRFGTLSFYDLAGVRLMLDQLAPGAAVPDGSPVYFRVADIVLARRELEGRGVVFEDQIHLVSPMEDHDLWMTFFRDPDAHILALMMEAPKGYQPVSAWPNP